MGTEKFIAIKMKQRCKILEINGSREVHSNQNEAEMQDIRDKREQRSS